AQSHTVVKAVSKTVPKISSAQNVSGTVQKGGYQNIPTGNSYVPLQVITLIKSTRKQLTLTQVQLVTLVKSVVKLLTLTQAQLVTLTRATSKLKTISLTQAQLVILT